jgi:2-polyprenyl-6-methoxyphenol hydroxylase-like FAD-dependent oxidoreductase
VSSSEVEAVSEETVLVVGAGPTGLVLALTLARAGLRPRIIDARAAAGGHSRALDVQARTLELYRQLGVVEGLLRHGVRIQQVAVRAGGRTVSETDVRTFGQGLSPYPFSLSCPQDDHEALLADALARAGVHVAWGTALIAVADRGDHVAVTLRQPDGSTETADVGYVAGCDGAHSTVRQEIGLPFRGSTSQQRYFVADVQAEGPVTVAPAAGGSFSFCLSDEDFILAVPARRTGTLRVVGLVPSRLAHRETLTFEDLRDTVERTTDTRVRAVVWFSTYRVSHRVAARFRSGRAFLLGDAGHVHSPLGGQGMNTGIADAGNLGWKLAAVLQGRAASSILDSYEPERIRFARSLVRTTDALFEMIAGPGRRQRLARGLIFRSLLPALLRVPVTRAAVCGCISQIRVSYRASPLSSGRAGRVRGGDRLPWLQLEDGRDNFEPLATLDWQVHVYGVAGPGLRALAEQRGLALHAFGWDRRSRAAGLRRDALYLVRPDGYVALAARRQDVCRLAAALDRFSLVPAHDAQAVHERPEYGTFVHGVQMTPRG